MSNQNVNVYGWNGLNPQRMEVTTSGHQKVNVENTSIAITTSGTLDVNDSSANSKLSSIDSNAKIQTAQEQNKNGFSQVLLTSAGGTAVKADSTCTIQEDPEKREGWNCVNPVGGTKFNLYYFNGANEVITLGQVQSVYFKAFINVNTEFFSIPFVHIYTKPTGSGDAGAFYHSRIDYLYDNDDVIGTGEECVFYGKGEPATQFNNRKIAFNNIVVNGDGGDSEEVLYMTISSHSTATQDALNTTINVMGFNTANIRRNLNLIASSGLDVNVTNNNDPSTSSKQDEQTTLLQTLNGKITTGEDDTLSSAQQVLNYARKDASPTGLRALKCSDDGTLHSKDVELNDKISKGEDTTIISGSGGLQQVLLYGRDTTGDLHPIKTTPQGDLDVEIADFVKGQAPMIASFPVVVASDQSDINIKINAVNTTGSYQNLSAGGSLLPGGDSSAVDVAGVSKINILYEDTSTSAFDGLDVLASGNGGTNYNIVSQLYPTTNNAGTLRYSYLSLDVGGLDRIKLQNNSSTDTYSNVTASLFGSL